MATFLPTLAEDDVSRAAQVSIYYMLCLAMHAGRTENPLPLALLQM